MEFQYVVKRKEYLEYCKLETYMNPTIRKLQHRCWPVFPVILVLLLIAFRPTQPAKYILAVVAVGVWILLVNFLIGRIIQKVAQQKCDQVGKDAFQPLHIVFSDGYIEVNGTQQNVKNYLLFSKLVLILLKSDTTVILPIRVFDGDQEKLQDVLRFLEEYLI